MYRGVNEMISFLRTMNNKYSLPKYPILRAVCFTFLLLVLGGCGLFLAPAPKELNDQKTPPKAELLDASADSSQERPTSERNLSDVEVIWAVPGEPVDKYLLRYGFSKESLNLEIEIDASKLEKVQDPAHGEVYHYLINDVPSARTLYLTLISMRNGISSEPSQIFEIRGKD